MKIEFETLPCGDTSLEEIENRLGKLNSFRAEIMEVLEQMQDEIDDLEEHVAEVIGDDEDGEDCFPYNCDDLSDDADALASAGWGCDEDYGYFGDDDYF